MIKIQSYDGWTGKAERPLAKWLSPRLTLLQYIQWKVRTGKSYALSVSFSFWSLIQKGSIPAKLILFYGCVTFFSLSYSINNLLPWSPHVPKAN